MATKTKEMKFTYIQPASHKQIGHLETGDKVIEGQLTLHDTYLVGRQTDRFSDVVRTELQLPEGVDLEAMIGKVLIDAQILGHFMTAMNVPTEGIIEDLGEVPMKPYTKAKRIDNPTSPSVGKAFTGPDKD